MSKILVIEDDVMIRGNIAEMLEDEGFEVIDAAEGYEGLQLAQEHLPNLVLCDVMMPRIDGYEVLFNLRQDSKTALIPFIYLTAKADKSDVRRGMNLGADDYLTKPFTREELVEAVTSRLNKQAAMTEHHAIELKQLESHFQYLFSIDSVTGLPNRLSLQEHFDHVLTQGVSPNRVIAIFCINVHNLEPLITILDEAKSAQLLQEIVVRLAPYVSNGDVLARSQDSQFAMILTSQNCQERISEIAQKILKELSRSFRLDEQKFYLNASIGIAVYPVDGCSSNTLIKRAEAAAAWGQQKGYTYQFFTSEMQAISPEALLLESALREALERSEFQVYYQPKVDLKTGQIVGAEGLLRWFRSEQGFISPANFLPLAETTGLIVPIGEWVFRTVCLQTKAWQTNGFPDLRIAVNLSPQQFNQPDLIQSFTAILQETNLDSSALELEITESCVIENPQAAIAILNEFRNLGLSIAIDDFGTGYSSLSYLKQFPFDTLKVDQCFVQGIDADSKNAEITKAIIQMAHHLKFNVVAEGVETEPELAFLRQYECDEIQGYLFSRPLPAAEFEQLLRSGKCLDCPNDRTLINQALA